MTRKLTIIALLVGITVLILGVVKWIAWTPTREMETTARSMIGRPEAELVQALGQPRHVVSSATLAGRTVDYPWKGMSFVPVPDLQCETRYYCIRSSTLRFMFMLMRRESLSMSRLQGRSQPPNHALQRTRPSCRGCHRGVPWAGSLSLGR
jgi:hypothetical protein